MSTTAFCFGEILWDMLPNGAVLGGAPFNVAFHLNRLGCPTGMISCIGKDDLGKNALDFLKKNEISTDWLQIDPKLPTGKVSVLLNERGQAEYEILEGMAYDEIAYSEALGKAVSASKVLIFGTLAARSAVSKNTLLRCCQKAKMRVLDINLRAPFYSLELLNELLPLANIIKMNDEELDLLCGWYGLVGAAPLEKMKVLLNLFSAEWLIVTRGAAGAIAIDRAGNTYQHSGYPVQVADTVGSGDAFLAGFLFSLLNVASISNCLDAACKMGAYVATKRGGTPDSQGIIAIVAPK